MDDRNDWHSIRPWRPSLALSVREITSVSVTFILSSPYSAADSLRSSPASSDDGYDPGAHPQPDGDSDDSDSASDAGNAPAQPQVVADVLNKGLSVKVNGIPWQRVLIRMDDEVDEAVIILFGLMPGRQYDVELGVMPRERSMRGLITTACPACAQDRIVYANERTARHPPMAISGKGGATAEWYFFTLRGEKNSQRNYRPRDDSKSGPGLTLPSCASDRHSLPLRQLLRQALRLPTTLSLRWTCESAGGRNYLHFSSLRMAAWRVQAVCAACPRGLSFSADLRMRDLATSLGTQFPLLAGGNGDATGLVFMYHGV
ncbi:predicted protein [Postia placenta Mad-698-R]|nr:predicted protein [Postia placenta Mad-698-R]